MFDYEENDELIERVAARDDLTGEDVLNLTIARRLNRVSDSIFAQAMGGLARAR